MVKSKGKQAALVVESTGGTPIDPLGIRSLDELEASAKELLGSGQTADPKESLPEAGSAPTRIMDTVKSMVRKVCLYGSGERTSKSPKQFRAAFIVESVTRTSGEPLPVDSYDLLMESADGLLSDAEIVPDPVEPNAESYTAQ